MPTTITEIKNLTNGKTIVATELTKFDNKTAFAEKITGTGIAATEWSGFAALNDNIQVTWTDGTGQNAKVAARGVAGRCKVDGTVVTISGLTNAAKYRIGLNGKIAIGPNETKAALISVRMGNIPTKQNPSGDWLIDFSDKEDEKATGSEINLKELIDWLSKNSGDKPDAKLLPDIKGEGGVEKKPEDFIIEFKNFYFNITQKTFDFWVVSKEGQTIQFGDFTILKVGFRVTNVAPAIEDEGEE